MITKGVVIVNYKNKRMNKKIAKYVGRHSALVATRELRPETVLTRDEYYFVANNIYSYIYSRPSFRNEVLNCKYFYYNNRIWLYHPDVFHFGESGIKISKIAKDNSDKFCLIEAFSVDCTNSEIPQYSTEKNGAAYEIRKRSRLGDDYEGTTSSFFKSPAGTYYNETQYEETLKVISNFITKGGDGTASNFSIYFSKLLDDRKISTKKLADLTNISSKTIERMRRDNTYTPSVEYIILCCVVLRLPPWDSDMLLYFAGYRLRMTETKDRIYIVIIHILYASGSIELCDKLLEEHHFPTLSSIIQRNQKTTK